MLMPAIHSERDGYIHGTARRASEIIGLGREVVLGRRKDSSTFAVRLSVSEYEIDGKRHFAGIVHDLTAQRLAEPSVRRRRCSRHRRRCSRPSSSPTRTATSSSLIQPFRVGYAPDGWSARAGAHGLCDEGVRR